MLLITALVLSMAPSMVGAVDPLAKVPQTQPRTEVPIMETVLPDGTPRYSVRLRVDGGEIEVGLDTGSSGLRVLWTTVEADHLNPTGHPDFVNYGNGVRLDGHVVQARVDLGGVASNIPVQIVQSARCVKSLNCQHVPPHISQFRFMADGSANKGYVGILGINMGRSKDIDQPLLSMGFSKWIVELPSSSDPKSGRLILNPSSSEVSLYTMVDTIGNFSRADGLLHDALRGCLVENTLQQKICGAVAMDTGDPGIAVFRNDDHVTPWPNSTPLTLFFAASSGKVHIAFDFRNSSSSITHRLKFIDMPGARQPFILPGVLPFLAYSVLYEPLTQTIGFRPRVKTYDDAIPFYIK